jgi:AAA+ ATPase superfamily predicted ATPase
LIELELVRREIPFGAHSRDSKRTYYEIADPFLRFWYRYVEPNRSRLQTRRLAAVAGEIKASFAQYVSQTWEDLARNSVSHLQLHGHDWNPASRWWGPGLDRNSLEIDVVAESLDGKHILLGEAKWSKKTAGQALLESLRRKVQNFPGLGGRKPLLALWLREGPARFEGVPIVRPEQVLRALR